MKDITRKRFLCSLSAAIAAGRSSAESLSHPAGKPLLTLGVISDTHVTTPESCEEMENALRYFKSRGVDAVLNAGDLTDWGLRSGLRYVKETWDRVFGGTDVKPLFITGNHDDLGWYSPSLGLEMRANGYSEYDNLKFSNGGMKANWEAIMGEPYAPIRVRTVNGFDFISAEWTAMKDFPAWMEANGSKYRDGRLFFYFQHDYIHGCWCGEGPNVADATKRILDTFPNCIAFTGHLHTTFNNERAINQTGFTHIGLPSLSYNGIGGSWENGGGEWWESHRGQKDPRIMPPNPARFLQRGDQGLVVSVYRDRLVAERFDFEEMEHGAPDWVVPLPVTEGNKPFDWNTRVNAVPAPAFPPDATVRTFTRHWTNRSGEPAVPMVCTFPAAIAPNGYRIDRYRIRALLDDGTPKMTKCFVDPAFGRAPKHCQKTMQLWFDVKDLPQGVNYRLEVTATTPLGKYSAPIYSKVQRSEPGLEKSRLGHRDGLPKKA